MLKNPPTNFKDRLKHLGPSLIVTANIVGAGELIMTTTLGAEAGYVALWIILFSCIVKVMVQLEFGKHAICTGETTLEAFAKLPGPQIGRGHWSIWMWMVIKALHFLQMGGMVGGVALALKIAFPQVPVWMLACVVAGSIVWLVLWGKYTRIEKISVGLIAVFSIFTVVCVFLLKGTPYAVQMSDILEGLSFQMPEAILAVALGAFSITGVSSEEAMSYPYWCIEKGYAKFTGIRDQSTEWAERARGWIKVMYLDAFLSMIIYTVTTAAFYLLGASVLHRLGVVPEGYETISVLSKIYTEAVGPEAKVIFLVGAIIVLFSSLFIGAATNQRLITDAFAQMGFLDYRDEGQRQKWFRVLAWFLPIAWTLLFLVFKAPVYMVMFGAIALSILLLVVVLAALYFRYRRLDKRLRPSPVYDICLWLSALTIFAFGVQAILMTFVG